MSDLVKEATATDMLPHLLRMVMEEQGHSRNEVSSLSGIPVGTVGSWTSRALLREEVQVDTLRLEALLRYLKPYTQ